MCVLHAEVWWWVKHRKFNQPESLQQGGGRPVRKRREWDGGQDFDSD